MKNPQVTALDERLARPMFWVTVLFLTMCAGVLHLHGDTIHETADQVVPTGEPVVEAGQLSRTASFLCWWGIVLLYPLFLLETVLHWRAGGRPGRQHVLSCLLPPLRLGVRDHRAGSVLWLPWIGWAAADDALLQRVERGAKWPMILIALLVLPLLAFEHFYVQRIQSSPWLTLFVQISSALIWMAFAFEFVVMTSITRQKWRYAREHWIDLLIILIPMFDFLRALRLGRLLRMQQVLRAMRLVRLRGTLLRAWRAVLLLEIVDRFLRPRPQRRLEQLRLLVEEQERQLAELKQEITQIEDEMREQAMLEDAVRAAG